MSETPLQKQTKSFDKQMYSERYKNKQKLVDKQMYSERYID
jgi:hypothetical protein